MSIIYLQFIQTSKLTGNTCIAEAREPRRGGGGRGGGGGGGGDAHKMSGMEGGENWSKLCSLGGS